MVLSKAAAAVYLRNIVFGVEDSLVSTVGLLSGIAIAAVPRGTIFLTGMILIAVEAFSMGVGSLLTEASVEEFVAEKDLSAHRQIIASSRSIKGGVIMFVSYYIAGFVPLLPYVFFETAVALRISIFASLAGLFLLGALSALKFKRDFWRTGLRMMILGGFAVAVGVAVGRLMV